MNQISYERIQDILDEFFQCLDELFFFNILNREVWAGRAGALHCRKLVVIKVHDYPDPQVDGLFRVVESSIHIWLRHSDKGQRHSFEYLICLLLHEMTHAYIATFADQEDDKYYEHVADYENHGTMFWMLLKFVLRRIFEITRSQEVWNEILAEERRRVKYARNPQHGQFFRNFLKVF
ncbi:hypothetical protein O1611_g815 [Lasiodiplodia mahajangana]|uniref:Uncharacterized protein n=1 Tax=Lasiodiplodia mahajangana TaxID=1108764 RepID=A0ACC2JZF9_9PEZI|nr:hypothetical protein O1611_g815 [Lasiodiplodia mahajangana]